MLINRPLALAVTIGGAAGALARGWRATAVVVAATVVPLLLLDIAASVVGAGRDGLMLNGVPWSDYALPTPVAITLTLLGSVLIGQLAGGLAIVVRGELAGVPVDGVTAVRRAAARWLSLTGLVWALAVATGLAGLASTLLLVATAGLLGMASFLVLLAFLAVVLRLGMALPAVAVDGARVWRALADAWAAARGRAMTAGLVILAGVVAPVMLASWARNALTRAIEVAEPGTGFGVEMLARVTQLSGIVNVVVAAVVVTTFTALHHRLTGAVPAINSTTPPQPGERSRTPRWLSLTAVALLSVPPLLGAALVPIDPFGAPVVTVHRLALPAAVDAFALSGGRAVFVGDQSWVACLSTGCGTTAVRGMSEPVQAAAVQPDGTIVGTSTFNNANELRLISCRPDHPCEQHGAPLRLPTTNGAGVRVTIMPAASALAEVTGEILVAAATPDQANDDGTARTDKLTLSRCADLACAAPRVIQWGSVPHVERPALRGSLALTVDTAGRPVIAYRTVNALWIGTCDTATCGEPRITRVRAAADQGAVHYDEGEPEDRGDALDVAIVSAASGRLVVLDRHPGASDRPRVTTCDGAAVCETVALDQDQVWIGAALATDPAGDPVFAVRTLDGPRERIALITCPDGDCARPVTTLLNPQDEPATQARLAIGSDGLVLAYGVVDGGGGRVVSCATPDCRP